MKIENLLKKMKVADQESGREPVKIPEILIEKLKPFGKRFIKIKPPVAGDKHSGKKAVEHGFQNKPYEADDPELQTWLAMGGNYGILGGKGITIVDSDTKKVCDIFKSLNTLTQKSGRADGEGRHFIFRSNITENATINDPKEKVLKKQNVGNIQADNKYVVGAGCHHFTGDVYKIINDVEPVWITKEIIDKLFKGARFKVVWTGQKRKEIEKEALYEEEQLGEQIPLRDLIDLNELTQLSNDELQGSHPIHGSTTGQNFCVNLKKNVWHCFRCNSGGGGLMWIAVQEELLKCHEAQKGALKGKKFLKAVKAAEEMGFDVGLKEEHVEPDVERFFIDNPNGTKSFVSKWVADELMQEYTYVTQKEGRVMFVYNPKRGIYELMAEQQIEERTQQKIGRHNSIYRNKDIIGHINRSTYKKLEDTPIELISVKNGLLNIKGRNLEGFTPEYFIINQFPVKFDPKAKCPKFLKFLSEVISKADMIIMQEFFGFLLLRSYYYQKAILMLGDGSNGKTTLLRLMEAFIGKKNCAHEPLQILMINRFAMGKLYGKLANIYDDLPDMALKNVGFFKILTGEGTVTAEFKFKDRFDFENYAKMVFTCNVIPPCPEDTTAFFRRWLLIDFPNTFTDESKDPKLFSKLNTPEELSGILNWALDGLDRLQKKGHFTNAGTVEEIRERYLASAEPVKSFAENRLEEAEGKVVSKEELYQAYREYCKKLKIKIVPSGTMTRLLPTYINARKSRKNWFDIIIKNQHGSTQESKVTQTGGCVKNDTTNTDKKNALVLTHGKKDDKSDLTDWLKKVGAVKEE